MILEKSRPVATRRPCARGRRDRRPPEGPGATAFLERTFCSSVPKVGRVRLSYLLTPKGRIWSEATVARLSENRYLLCGPTLADRRDHDWLNGHLPDDGSVRLRQGAARDATLMVMGPSARTLLSRLTNAELSSQTAPWMSASELEVAGRPVTALRVSYVEDTVLGAEVHSPGMIALLQPHRVEGV